MLGQDNMIWRDLGERLEYVLPRRRLRTERERPSSGLGLKQVDNSSEMYHEHEHRIADELPTQVPTDHLANSFEF